MSAAILPGSGALLRPLDAPVTIGMLETRYGVCAGISMGFGDSEFGPDGRWQWGGVFLPQQDLHGFLRQRFSRLRRDGGDPERPFLLVLGQLRRSNLSRGTPCSLFGIALTEPRIVRSGDVLHPHHLARRDDSNWRGAFPWKEGMPFRRVWICHPAVALETFTGVEQRFTRVDGRWIRPLGSIAPHLPAAIAGIRLREVAISRAGTIPEPARLFPA